MPPRILIKTFYFDNYQEALRYRNICLGILFLFLLTSPILTYFVSSLFYFDLFFTLTVCHLMYSMSKSLTDLSDYNLPQKTMVLVSTLLISLIQPRIYDSRLVRGVEYIFIEIFLINNF